ncbi:MAG: hypothetical protein HGA95_01860, partial [Caldiserica bacterium]|nr:hypothetical protein [Caldisericota bacterium]
VFRQGDYQPLKSTDEGAKVASPSPNNIICSIAQNNTGKDVIDKYLTAQNVIDQKDIVAYLDKNAKLVGEKIKGARGWILGQKKEDGVMQGSFVAFIESKEVKIYVTAKFDSEENQKVILSALKSIVSPESDNLESYTDTNNIATISKPEGWKIDISSQTLQMHQVLQNFGAMIYPSGTRTTQELTPSEVNEAVKKQQGNNKDNPIGEVVSGVSIPMPLIDYMAVYSIDKNVDPKALDQRFSGMIGFTENGINDPYTWVLDTINKKGLSMANCPGKYFISDKPIYIMQAKPAGTLFAVVEGEMGKVLIMAGWTNDGIKKIIIDTLNKITSVSTAAKAK